MVTHKPGYAQAWLGGVHKLLWQDLSIIDHLSTHPHSNLNDQNLFHSTIDASPGVTGVSKNLNDKTEVHSGELER